MKKDKKEEILKSAMKEFAEHGFCNAKISKIAEMADIAIGSIYLYFESKESILEELFIRSWSKIDQKLAEVKDLKSISNKSKMEELVNTIILLVAASPDLTRMILHEYKFWNSHASDSVNSLVLNSKNSIIQILKAGKKAKEFRQDMRPEIATDYLIGGVWFLLAYWAENFESIKIEKIKKEAYSLLFSGLEE